LRHSHTRKDKLISLKFGLTGDTHNNLKNIKVICDLFNSHNLDFVIHTGDITLPKSLLIFQGLRMPLKGVFGNNDTDEKEGLLEVCDKFNFNFHDELKISIGKNRFLFATHDPKDIKQHYYGQKNIIVHGHTHRFRDEIINETHIFNPGECAGIIKGSNKIGIVDTDKCKMKIIYF